MDGTHYFGKGYNVPHNPASRETLDMEGADPIEHLEAGSPAIRVIFAEEESEALTS